MTLLFIKPIQNKKFPSQNLLKVKNLQLRQTETNVPRLSDSDLVWIVSYPYHVHLNCLKPKLWPLLKRDATMQCRAPSFSHTIIDFLPMCHGMMVFVFAWYHRSARLLVACNVLLLDHMSLDNFISFLFIWLYFLFSCSFRANWRLAR